MIPLENLYVMLNILYQNLVYKSKDNPVISTLLILNTKYTFNRSISLFEQEELHNIKADK